MTFETWVVFWGPDGARAAAAGLSLGAAERQRRRKA